MRSSGRSGRATTYRARFRARAHGDMGFAEYRRAHDDAAMSRADTHTGCLKRPISPAAPTRQLAFDDLPMRWRFLIMKMMRQDYAYLKAELRAPLRREEKSGRRKQETISRRLF